MAKSKRKQQSPAAKDALARFKYEIADELGVHHARQQLKNSTFADKPTVGDYMVDQMMRAQESKMKK